MKKILVHRMVHEPATKRQVHGLKVVSVCDEWTASMGIFADFDMEPKMPDRWCGCFSNRANVATIDLDFWHPEDGRTFEEEVCLWLKGWHRAAPGDHYMLSIEAVLTLPLVNVEPNED